MAKKMSRKHIDHIIENYEKLRNNMPDMHKSGILSALQAKRIIKEKHAAAIQAELTSFAQATKFFDIVKKKLADKKYEKIVAVFDNCLEGEVIAWILGQCDNPMNEFKAPMSDAHKNHIISIGIELQEHMPPMKDGILSALVQAGVINDRMQKEIAAETTPHRQAHAFFDMLVKRPDVMYLKTVEVFESLHEGKNVASLLKQFTKESTDQETQPPKSQEFSSS